LRDQPLPLQGPTIRLPKSFDSCRHIPVTRDTNPNIAPRSPGLGTGIRQMHSPGPEDKLPQLFPGGGMMTHYCKPLPKPQRMIGTRPCAPESSMARTLSSDQPQNCRWQRQHLPHLIPTTSLSSRIYPTSEDYTRHPQTQTNIQGRCAWPDKNSSRSSTSLARLSGTEPNCPVFFQGLRGAGLV